MAKLTLIFNQPASSSLPFVLLAGLFGFDVLVVDNKSIRTRPGWAWGARKGLYRARSMIAIKPAHSLAIEQSQAMVRAAPQAQALNAWAGEDADALVARLLAERLLDYHAVEEHLVPELLEQGRTPVVCSADHASMRRLLVRHGFALGGARLLFSAPLRFCAWAQATASSLAVSLLVACGLTWQKVLSLLGRPLAPAKNFVYAVSLPFGFFTKFQGRRAYDFLVDDATIKRKDTVFLDEFDLDPAFIQAESARGSNFFRFRGSLAHDLLRQNFHGPWVGYCFRLLRFMVGAGGLAGTVRMAAKLILLQAVVWQIVTARCRFRHLVTAMSDSAARNAANLVLRRYGVTTWYYNAAIGSPYLYDREGSAQDSLNVLWEGRILDWLVVNSQAFADSQASHGQRVQHCAVVGNIYSEMIASLSPEEAEARLGVSRGDAKAVIACFDTSYVDDKCCATTFEDASGFYTDLLRLSQSRPEYLVLIKPSKDDRYFTDASGLWASARLGPRIIEVRKALRLQPNVKFLADAADPTDVIAMADITITNGFSSPTADALAAGRRGFWYDAIDSHRGYCLDEVDLTRHGYAEMIGEVDRLLSMADDEFSAWLGGDPRRRHLLDPYMDQKALTRFRGLLAGS